jgi:REP element-mobilizing transposase RayT
MARPLRICYPGAFYHITSRGNERKAIFKGRADREKFLSYLESAVLRYDAIIHVYCLMDNHYHLLLETPYGNLSQIMRHINGAYATYFNTKHQRPGHLLQGRFKAILVEFDAYSKELSRYIHLNPLRANMIHDLDDYKWSSYLDYIGIRTAPAWLDTSFILGYFGKNPRTAKQNYREFVTDRLGQEYENPLGEVVGSTILGSIDYVKHIKAKFIQGKKPNRDLPALNALISKPTIEDIKKAVKSHCDHQPAMKKNVALYLCHKYTTNTLKLIGHHFGIGESAVSQASRRVKERLRKDKNLKKQIEGIESSLDLSKV